MNLWKIFSVRWDERELRSWTSFKKTAYLLLPLLVYFVVHDITEFVLWAFMEFILTGGGEGVVSFCTDNANTLQGIINGLAILIGVASIWNVVRNEIGVKVISQEGFQEKGRKGKGRRTIDGERIAAYCLLAVLAFCAALGLNILFSQTGFSSSSEAYDSIYEMQYGVQFAVGLILYGIVSPLAEEAVFRGLIYNRMKRCFNYPIALVVSSLLFGFYHGNPVQALYGMILGLLIAYIYEKYGGFGAPVLFHAVANVSIFALSYNNRLRGLSQEAGIGLMAVMLAGAGVCLWQIKKRDIKKISAEIIE